MDSRRSSLTRTVNRPFRTRLQYHESMTGQEGEDLGHGVYVIRGPGSEITVISQKLDLGWSEAGGGVPGTAVLWREGSFEVVAGSKGGRGDRWALRVWDDGLAMREVFSLEEESIREIADDAASAARDARVRKATMLLLPLLGFAPAALQKTWSDGWGFNAERATQMSAVCEMIGGAVGIIQLAGNAFGGETFMPIWLPYLGLYFFASGFVRLALVAADQEPIGSILGLALLPLASRRISTGPETGPSVRSFDRSLGKLVLESPVHRRDWDRDGSLPFRGEVFRLDRVEHWARSWVYFFLREDSADLRGRVLRVAQSPAARPSSAPVDSAPPPFLRTMLVSAAVTLGPASDQERWSAELSVRAVWLTVVGASAELLGAIVNLQHDLGSTTGMLVLFNLFLAGEGLLRLGSALIGRPMGSIFGWIVRPLYVSYLPPPRQ